MDKNARFICEVNDFPEVQASVEALTEFQKTRDERREFIVRQVKTLEQDEKNAWKAVWESLKKTGKIDPNLDYDAWSISLIADRTQVFIEPAGDSSHPLHALLSALHRL